MARMLIGLVALSLGGCVSIDAQRSEIDAAMWSEVAVEYGPAVEDEAVVSYVAALGERLAAHAPESDEGPASWSFIVLDDDSLQAFGTIDGTVALTRGLAVTLGDEDALAGEVARQIAHARLQHLWKFMNSQIASAGFFIWPKGAATGMDDAKIEYASWLFHRDGVGFMHPFQEWQLLEADEAAMVMLEGAGMDPAGVRRCVEVAAGHPGSQYGLCYGHPEPRLKAIQSRLGAADGVEGDGDEGGFAAFRGALTTR